MKNGNLTRRSLLVLSSKWGTALLAQALAPSVVFGKELQPLSSEEAKAVASSGIDIVIGKVSVEFDGRKGTAIGMNGTVPGAPVRLREGQEAIIRVTNTLDETTSIHWHGLILPDVMDGVPGVTFAGIKPGETFTYRFPVVQSGTYWCHSHSGGQEQLGLYAPLIINPKGTDPIVSDRDHIVMFSDWSFIDPMKLIAKLKKESGYFNYQRRTFGDFMNDIKETSFTSAASERLRWMKMRMEPTDILDISGPTYTYLTNGKTSLDNWTALFKKGERVRLRFINGSAMTIFDVRVEGLKMMVVQSDGQNVQPVEVEEFRFGPGETYDVVVIPKEEKPYAIFAEAMDRSGYAMGTLSPKVGFSAPVPERRSPPVRGMDDMGMAMSTMDMEHSGHNMNAPSMRMDKPMAKGHDMSKMNHANAESSVIPGSTPVRHGPDHHGFLNASVPEETKSRLHEPGTGLGKDGRRVLVYTDLKSTTVNSDTRMPEREIELHLTGNMERFMWSIDGKKYSEASEPIPFHYGERVRLTLVNDTMMEHPMHLHGMFMDLENGAGSYLPRKHTIIVKPAERLSLAITADALGDWAFHCHMLYHMEMGMFRVVRVAKKTEVLL